MSAQPTPLVAEVISIGDEMTTGARLDTNSQWLSQQLAALGIRTLFHTTVGDQLAANVDVLRTAAWRADVVVTSGGLGPTEDDLTREAIAEASGCPLEFRADAYARIESLFAHRGRAMPDRNRVQAMFPQGSREIPNPQGTAAGIDLPWPTGAVARESRIFALPGVPAELQQMWAATVAPRLVDELGAGRRRIRQHVVKCFGVGESEMERLLGGLISRDHVPSVGITVSRATISLRITAESEDDAACDRLIATTRSKIFDRVGDYVFGEGESYELQHAVAARLAARGDALTVLELGFGGLAGGWLAELQQEGLLQAHLLAPSAPVLARLLEPTADDEAKSEDRTLLAAACAKTGAAWGLLINDYPALQQTDQPLAAHPLRLTVYDAAADCCRQEECALGGHPDIIKARIAKAGLDFLRRQLP